MQCFPFLQFYSRKWKWHFSPTETETTLDFCSFSLEKYIIIRNPMSQWYVWTNSSGAILQRSRHSSSNWTTSSPLDIVPSRPPVSVNIWTNVVRSSLLYYTNIRKVFKGTKEGENVEDRQDEKLIINTLPYLRPTIFTFYRCRVHCAHFIIGTNVYHYINFGCFIFGMYISRRQ